MTKKPLSASPLRILAHRFTRIEVLASETESDDAGMSLATKGRFIAHEEDPRKWLVTLELTFGENNDDAPSPYSGRISIEGEFQVTDGFPQERMQTLIEVTGSSILYGACREMLANLTARSTHGMISLPSVSFLEAPAKPKKKAAKKATKKSATKKSTRSKK